VLSDPSLQRFVDRIARHPTLQRSQLVNDFLQSTEWVSRTLNILTLGCDQAHSPVEPPSRLTLEHHRFAIRYFHQRIQQGPETGRQVYRHERLYRAIRRWIGQRREIGREGKEQGGW
jgi:hypothetical protein